MGTILKFTFQNIKQDKFRTFLIIFAITLSAALLFSSLAISKTVEQMYLKRMSSFSGTAEISIRAGQNAASPFFHAPRRMPYQEELEYMIGAIETRGYYEVSRNEQLPVIFAGYELQDLAVSNPVTIEEGLGLDDFTGKKIIIGSDIAQKYGLTAGDEVAFEIDGGKHRFIVSGIAVPEGLFLPQTGTITAVVPRETIASLLGARGRVNVIYVKAADVDKVDQIMENLALEYPRNIVKRTLTREEIQSYIKGITTPFLFMLILVLFTSIFIIYSAFKVITMERLPVIGTLRSIGATKKMTDVMLLMESAIYGFIGGVAGGALGFVILYVMTEVLTKNSFGGTRIPIEIAFSYWHLWAAFLLALVLSLVSSLIPILKVAKISVKDIVLNTMENRAERGRVKIALGIILGLLGLLLPKVVSQKAALGAGSIANVFIGTSIVLLVPFFVELFILCFQRVVGALLGNEGSLALKNMRDNKSSMNNIALLATGISGILMINTLSYSVGIEVLNVYNNARFDIMLNHPRADRTIEQSVKTVEGVTTAYGLYEAHDVEVVEKKDKIFSVFGIDPNRYFEYWDLEFTGDKEELLAQFDQGSNIIVSTFLKEKFGLEKGGVLTLKLNGGQNSYLIAGFVNTLLNNGNLAFIPEKYLKREGEQQYFSDIYIKTVGDPSVVKQAVMKKFARDRIWIKTMEELEQQNMQSNNQMFMLLGGFSMIAMLIGVVGVFNNFIVSFLSRKRQLAVLRSVGMSKRQVLKMLLIEASCGGIIGGFAGITGGLLFLMVLPVILKAMEVPVAIHYSQRMFGDALFAGIFVSVIASVSSALRSAKINIVEALKHV